jgi:hypothetical protein
MYYFASQLPSLKDFSTMEQRRILWDASAKYGGWIWPRTICIFILVYVAWISGLLILWYFQFINPDKFHYLLNPFDTNPFGLSDGWNKFYRWGVISASIYCIYCVVYLQSINSGRLAKSVELYIANDLANSNVNDDPNVAVTVAHTNPSSGGEDKSNDV